MIVAHLKIYAEHNWSQTRAPVRLRLRRTGKAYLYFETFRRFSRGIG
jgi:hypothetical protein